MLESITSFSRFRSSSAVSQSCMSISEASLPQSAFSAFLSFVGTCQRNIKLSLMNDISVKSSHWGRAPKVTVPLVQILALGKPFCYTTSVV